MSRLGGNSIGGHYDFEKREFVSHSEGIIALCKGLKGSAVTSLECAATLLVFAFLSAPVDTSQRLPPYPRSRSLGRNDLGPEGATALAEGLKGNSTLRVLE